MSKKSLYLGSITLILSALFALTGCFNPAADGPKGAPGRESLSGTVSAVTLRELFAVNNTVQLLTGGTTVTGEIPPGKTLEISGVADVAAGNLEVNGVLDIKAGGELISHTGGKLYLGRNGRVLLNGYVYLEQELFLEQPIEGELNSGEVSFDPRVILGAAGGLSLPKTVAAAGVNNYFTKVNSLKWASTTPLTTTTLSILTNWKPGKTLNLNPATTIAATTNIDVSGKGTLIIDGPATPTLTLGAFTLKANGRAANVIVGKEGSINLSDPASALAGNIKVKGALIAGSAASTITIPGTVDLSEATLRAGTNNGVFYFADTAYTLGRVDAAANNPVFRESRGLFIREVINTGATAGRSLTIPPAVTTTIEEVITDGAHALTITSITGVQNAILKPGYVSGAAGLILGQNLYLTTIDGSTITVAGSSKITVNNLTDLGSNAAIQSEVISKIRGGTLVLDGVAPAIVEPITINTAISSTGNFTIAADTTFKVSPALGSITINKDKNLILDSGVTIPRGAVLNLTEGVYQAVQSNVTIPASGIITAPGVIEGGLKIGANVMDIANNYIALTSGAGGPATFTPAAANPAAPVTFGKAGITIPGGATAAAKLVVSGTTGTLVGKITVAGTGVGITLGADAANAGVLGFRNGAKLVAADIITAAHNALPNLGDYIAAGPLAAAPDSTNGITITAKTPANGAVITSATKSTN
jgi:hypothetical protein